MHGKLDSQGISKNDISITQNGFGFFNTNEMSDDFIPLITAVVNGCPEDVTEIIKHNPTVLLERDDFFDLSDRRFINCSVLDYVMWALDVKFMANTILDAIPKTNEGIAILKALHKEFKQMIQHGVRYKLQGRLYHEIHYDHTQILQEYEKYITHFGDWTREQLDDQWVNKIGSEQWFLPTHVAQHLCDPNLNIDQQPYFSGDNFARSLNVLDGNDEEDCSYISWYSPRTDEKGLGIDYAIIRTKLHAVPVVAPPKQLCAQNLEAIKELFTSRLTRDLLALEDRLEKLSHVTASPCVGI